MDNRLLKICEKMVSEEKAKNKKKKSISLVKEKRINYYSGWHKNDRPVTEENGERQKRLE